MQEKESYSRYEKTRIVSARALQIAQGSPVLTKIPKSLMDPVEIAKIEWEAGVIPIDIKIKEELPLAGDAQRAKVPEELDEEVEDEEGEEFAEEEEKEIEKETKKKTAPKKK